MRPVIFSPPPSGMALRVMLELVCVELQQQHENAGLDVLQLTVRMYGDLVEIDLTASAAGRLVAGFSL